jgi:RNA polymerase sigma-70 factor (ECF subfamily)
MEEAERAMPLAVINAMQPVQIAEHSDEHDRELLARIVARDRAALEALYCAYYHRLGRFLARQTQHSDLADEIINDTFWVVWEKARDFRGGSLVSTWIMGITYRCMLKLLRRMRSASPAPSAEIDIEQLPTEDEPLAAHELSDWVRHGLQRLPTEQRLTMEFAYFLGHSCEEIAAIMDCPVNTVKGRMFQARIKLRNLLPALADFGKGNDRERTG